MAEAPTSDQLLFIDMSQEPVMYLNDGNFLNQTNQTDQTSEEAKYEEHMEEINEMTFPIKEDKEDKEDNYLKIQPRKIRCPECNRYSAENEEKMQRHIRRKHRGENPYQCYMCDYSTYNSTLFEEHVRIHQGIKPFKCTYCEYRSVSKKNTKKHELIHRPDNPLKCPDCDFIAHHKRSLTTHRQKHITDMASANNKFKCGCCSFVTYNKVLLAKHKRQVHNRQKLGSRKPKNDLSFICDICHWTSNHKPRILLHLIHHPNQIVDELIVDTSVLKKFGIMS